MRLREQDLVWREIDGEIVLLDLLSSKYLMINKTGSFLLQLLATEHDQQSLADALAERFGVTPEVAAADTAAFLAVLRDRRLLA
jgi:hypothetical protein